ncbi:MAG: arginine--tRNA ligase [Bacteroidales bacterium]|jgi:arginyl-tRNA synthetase|nr:arginine--tRNA ligase [Bacteroidales bacterium]
MSFEQQLKETVLKILTTLYTSDIQANDVQIQKTRKEFEGDFTVVMFPFVRYSKKSPDATADETGSKLMETLSCIEKYNVVKGFLNLSITDAAWQEYFHQIRTLSLPCRQKDTATDIDKERSKSRVVVEFSSPNTNKPLHLGHVRNNLLGNAICNILEADGESVVRVNLVNDRGIHICKSMLAWMKSGNGETPETSGMKGDKLVGKYYVEFDRLYKQEIKALEEQGLSKEKAEKQAPILTEVQQMLRQWEDGDPQIRALWTKMNQWVYDGFEQTYRQLGISFDKIYYESDTYLLGKKIIEEGLQKGVFYRHADGSVRVNLEQEGFEEKILLRSDGTSVYMTQDLGTATLRAEEYHPKKMIYIVGNEQNYHFDVLKTIVSEKLGYSWGSSIYHLSYGMVELPFGKMKSREGTVVDADDLMQEMILMAEKSAEQSGKSAMLSSEQQQELFVMTGVGALKYFILKVDPKKNMLFNPDESIDLNGNTAPFIQYAHARIRSLIRKAEAQHISIEQSLPPITIPKSEKELLRSLYEYPTIIRESAKELNPALIANYTFDLVKTYNHFYQETPVLREENEAMRLFRLQLSQYTSVVIKHAMSLLGIDVPEQM